MHTTVQRANVPLHIYTISHKIATTLISYPASLKLTAKTTLLTYSDPLDMKEDSKNKNPAFCINVPEVYMLS